MAPIDTGIARRTAEGRWAEIARISADLQPAIALQRRILRTMLDTAQEIEDDSASVDAMSSDAILGNWLRGLPALRNAHVPIPSRLKSALPILCSAMIEAGAGEAAEHIHSALENGRIDPDSLLRTSLARNDKAIRTSALHMDLSPDLVWLIGELGSAPLAHHLQHALSGRESLVHRLTHWDRGYCPYCGSWPVLIELTGESRALRCSFCAAAWTLTSQRCVYCANADERFVAAAPDPGNPRRRVEFCGACGCYTKVIAAAAPTMFPLLAIEDLATVGLDQVAMDRGYARPKLFDLDTIEPRTSAGGCT